MNEKVIGKAGTGSPEIFCRPSPACRRRQNANFVRQNKSGRQPKLPAGKMPDADFIVRPGRSGSDRGGPGRLSFFYSLFPAARMIQSVMSLAVALFTFSFHRE